MLALSVFLPLVALAEPAAPPPPASLAPLDVAAAALAQNPSVEAARGTVRAARAMADSEGAFPEPMLEAGLAPLSLASPFTGGHAAVGVEVMLSQPLPITNRLARSRDAARADAEAMTSSARVVYLELAERAAMLACDAWEAARAVDVNEHHRDLLASMRGAARDALGAGQGSVDEALRVDEEAAMLEDEDLESLAALDTARARINGLLHRAPDAPLPAPPAELPAMPLGEGGEGGAGAHPALDEAAALAKAAAARVDAADAANIPDLKLSATYNSMWPDLEHQFMLGVAVDIPSARTSRDATVERARAQQSVAERVLEERRDAVLAEQHAAQRALEEARARVKLFEERRLPLAAQRTQATRSAFGAGGGKLLDVLTALRDERHVTLEAHQARAEVCRREAIVRRARGVLDPLPSSITDSTASTVSTRTP